MIYIIRIDFRVLFCTFLKTLGVVHFAISSGPASLDCVNHDLGRTCFAAL